MSLLRIEPKEEVHFWLNDETPRCVVTMKQVELGPPVAFRIQPSQRHRYAIWPSLGVVGTRSTISISIVLLEHTKKEMLYDFKKLGLLAEFRQRDKFLVDLCEAPRTLLDQLCGDEDQDYEVLSSFWSRQNSGNVQALRVRFSMNDSTGTQSDSSIIPCISMDGSEHSRSREDALRKEINNLRRQCEELTVERDILENRLVETEAASRIVGRGGVAVHKWQLQQSLRCGNCNNIFSQHATNPAAPIVSQACGHTVCRQCVNKAFTIITHFDKKRAVPCLLCGVESAFATELHVNHSLCGLVALLEC